MENESKGRVFFRCPVCGGTLAGEKSLLCEKKHCFDVCSRGYVNLFLKKAADTTGDNPEMSRARHEFLSGGFYSPLADAICELISSNLPVRELTFADAGCGEGFYTARLYDYLKTNREVRGFGFDLSKTALKIAGRRGTNEGRDLYFALASIFSMPLPDNCADAVLSVFAPVPTIEAGRILKRDGVLAVISPAAEHLFELKSLIYNNPYKNTQEEKSFDGFSLIVSRRVTFKITLDRQSARNLFLMTPYSYKTSEADAEKLDTVTSLEVTADFNLRLYSKT